MRILVIKTSSLGDIIHTLPAITDARNAIPEIQIDWVAEQSFAEIPTWHPAIRNVIPVAIRRWRHQPWQFVRSGEFKSCWRRLRAEDYDHVIDAQGLLKSAILGCIARGPLSGLDMKSARGGLATGLYRQRHAISWDHHAITRARILFSQTLGYSMDQSTFDYGLDQSRLQSSLITNTKNYVVFLHGTTWESKQWPLSYWCELAKHAVADGFKVLVPWGNVIEKSYAEQIAQMDSNVTVLPKLRLTEMATVLSNARGVVAVDTGLAHLAAALSVPAVTLYGPTDPTKTGAWGKNQQHLSMSSFNCSPCFQKTCQYQQPSNIKPACFAEKPPSVVWQHLVTLNR